MKATHSEADLLEARRQIDSILHKLRETVRTLSAKENANKLKPQITLATRRVQALDIANDLIDEALGHRIWRLAEHLSMAPEAARWFSSKWGIPAEAYRESMLEGAPHGGSTPPDSAPPHAYPTPPDSVPQWYVIRAGDTESGRIIAGCGIIENDFHDRPDLAPNLCALYVEKDHRGRGLASLLLENAIAEARRMGRSSLYLVTDHVGLYERLGWKYLGDARDAEGAPVRVYQAPDPDAHSQHGQTKRTVR